MMTAVWLAARTFLSANGFIVASVVGLGVLFLTYDTSRFRAGVAKGKEAERAQTEAANQKAAALANRVRSSVRAGRVRKDADLDPYTVN